MSDHPNQLQKPRQKCPKGMKLPGAVKGQVALMFNRTKEERNYIMRSMGTAIHESANRIRNAARDAANQKRTGTVKGLPDTPDAE